MFDQVPETEAPTPPLAQRELPAACDLVEVFEAEDGSLIVEVKAQPTPVAQEAPPELPKLPELPLRTPVPRVAVKVKGPMASSGPTPAQRLAQAAVYATVALPASVRQGQFIDQKA